MITIGEKLKQLRKLYAFSQTEVATKLHLSRQTISKWELGKSQPDLFSLQQMALLYEVSLDELFDMKKEKEQMISTYKPENMSKALAQTLSLASPTEIQQLFVKKRIVDPLFQQLDSAEKIYWWGIDKQQTQLFSTPQPLQTDWTKTYLAMFQQDASVLLFATNTRIITFNILSFLEETSYSSYLYNQMDYLCIGSMFEEASSALQTFSLGIYLPTKHYTLFTLSAEKANSFIELFSIIDNNNVFFRKLSKSSMIEFTKNWRRNKFTKVQ